ncbi:hypothetical protein NW762_013747 [Fusarium torreyae]|uniref:Nucleoside phosphorylase domain-containing protein n=1 Tax=Fusarium torreyae TaxID=1237075 RepID=A0A9W8RP37_9HYPO|nr:hypothetical protein NW762_013747 [Fusarium torreyae]
MDRRRMSVDSDVTLVHHAKRRKTELQGFANDTPHGRYTVAWICALHFEMAAARAMLDEEHDSLPRQANDSNSYVLGSIQKHNVVIACLPTHQYGTNNAAMVLGDLKRTFPKIGIGLMVGIGGGVPTKADIRLGDIIVGVRVMQYDFGKVVDGKVQRTAVPKIPGSSIRTSISNLRSRHELSGTRVPLILRDKMGENPSYSLPDEPDRLFQSSYSHESSTAACEECDQSKLELRKMRVSTGPVIHYGGIASGNQVMKDAASRDQIARELDVICFEMEAAGLMDIMPCLPIRGICDYSDSHKAKGWQRYAAATAAAYAYEFLERWEEDAQDTEIDHLQPQNEHTSSSDRHRQILDSLNFDEIDARKTTIKNAHFKTCRWFLKHPDYLSWTNPDIISQHHGFLWIRGKPGAGKSTIMKFIYLESKRKDRKQQSLTASFFFNARGETLEKTVSGMYRSLLLQLFHGFPDLQCVIDDPEIIPQRQTTCPSLNVLKDLLRSALSKLGQRSFTCFIDALDECDEQQVMDLVEYFEDLAEEGFRLRICLSSRHYPYIDIRLGIRLTLEEQIGHASDLESYIKTHLRIKDNSLLTELQTKMLEKAAGVFLWVVLVVDVLNRENRRGRLSLKKRLEEVPSGLSELFKDLLRRSNTDMEELQLSLLWILLSKRPLKPEEYYHGLWSGLSSEGLADSEIPEVSATDADDCFDRCVISSSKGLAEITKTKRPTVQFIHESVRDFLIKDKGLLELWPELGPDWESLGHDRLKSCCNFYFRLVALEHTPHSKEQMCMRYPFLEYASQSVLHHADSAANTVCQQQFLSEFSTRDWVSIANTFEKYQSRRYVPGAELLYVLAERGHPSLIRTGLKSDPRIDCISEGDRYRYPLIAAMAKGNKDSVIALLGLSPDVYNGASITKGLTSNIDAKVTKAHTPFTWAFEQGHLDVAKVLVEKGTCQDEKDTRGWTLLMSASEEGRTDLARWLVDGGADIHVSSNGHTAIAIASSNGHVEIVDLLLKAGAHPDTIGPFNQPILCVAAGYGHLGVVRVLLKKGADIECIGNDGQRPLHFAAGRPNNVEVMEELLKHQANIHALNDYGDTCLLRAAKEGILGSIKFLLNHGANVRIRNNAGDSCMQILRTHKLDCLQVLLENGADVNDRDIHGQTLLHKFSYSHWGSEDYASLSQLLINHGADCNARDNSGNTPLHCLLRFGLAAQSAVSLLAGHKEIDINGRNDEGETPLHVAIKFGNSGLIDVLLQHGADTSHRDFQGRTPLDIALFYGRESAAELLVEKGLVRDTT